MVVLKKTICAPREKTCSTERGVCGCHRSLFLNGGKEEGGNKRDKKGKREIAIEINASRLI